MQRITVTRVLFLCALFLTLGLCTTAIAAPPKKGANTVTAKAKAPAPAAKPAPARRIARASDGSSWTTLPVKYTNGRTLVRLMKYLLGVEGSIRYSRELNVIFIKDKPSQIRQVIALQKRLDVPQKQFKLTLYLVAASQSKTKGSIDKNLPKALVSTLQMFRHYNTFRLQDAGYIQIANNQEGVLRLGGDQGLLASFAPKAVMGAGGQVSLKLKIQRLRMTHDKRGKLMFYRRTLLTTTLMTRKGNTVVVGASKINGRGQALVMIVKVN